MTEKQLKYMNKIKDISFFILVAGLIIVLVWSIMNKNASKPKEEEIPAKVLAINYDKNGEKAKYDFTCATQDCILSSQAGSYALVKDGSYKLVNLSNGSNKELQLPTMAKNFMVAGDTFYGLVFTADQTNKASFYDATTGETMYTSELNYEKMNAPSKMAMKMFVSSLKRKKNQTEDEKKMVEMISSSYDISDKKFIAPIVEYFESEN